MTDPYQVNILAILDHFSRKALHMPTFFGEPPDEWVTLERGQSPLSLRNLRSTFAEYNTPMAIITDHGGQFESGKFKQFLKNSHVEHRQGRAGLPYSNGKIERFFLSIQNEVLNYYPILTFNKLNKILIEYKVYYNQYRPHQSVNGAVPCNVYFDNSLSYKIPDKIQKRIEDRIKTTTFCDDLIKTYSLMN